jgi:hypothetical protein
VERRLAYPNLFEYFPGWRTKLWAMEQADVLPVFPLDSVVQLHTKDGHNHPMRIRSCSAGGEGGHAIGGESMSSLKFGVTMGCFYLVTAAEGTARTRNLCRGPIL